MKNKLIVLIVVVVLAAVLISGGIGYIQLRNVSRNATTEYLAAAAASYTNDINSGEDYEQSYARIEAAFVSDPDAVAADNSGRSDDKNESLMLRVTIIDSVGKVLYDSHRITTADNHSNREEIRQAFSNKTHASSIRYSETLRTAMIYYALYNPETDTVTRLSSPQASLTSTVLSYASVILAVMVISALLLIAIALTNLRKITKPLHQLEDAAYQLRQGDYNARVPDVHLDTSDLRALSLSFNEMAHTFQESHRQQEEYSANLNAILNSIQDLIIVVDEYNWVISMNKRAMATFDRSIQPEEKSCPLFLLTQDNRVDVLTEKARSGGKSVKSQLTLRMPNGNRRYKIVASPVQSERAKGVVVLSFSDITDTYQASTMRTEFVANVTHELRTPLTSIRGFIDTLGKKKDIDPATINKFINIIDIEAERLELLINDILALSAIESDNANRNLIDFDLNELIDEVVVLLGDYAHENKIALIPEIEETILSVRADRDRIKQVLINLIDNAIKYNKEGGKVWISVTNATATEEMEAELEESEILEAFSTETPATTEDLRMIVLTVRDNGTGIPSASLDRIFERFYRAETSRSRKLGGTGLGLSIVKHIAKLYRGYATAESVAGEGSVFRIFLKIGTNF
ncbi:MAG TPA: HAMP domain-containing protein [Clostridiaceae bacterium]|nr:HAMP domain-containing protein [Clostridiaceae bacterium]